MRKRNNFELMSCLKVLVQISIFLQESVFMEFGKFQLWLYQMVKEKEEMVKVEVVFVEIYEKEKF